MTQIVTTKKPLEVGKWRLRVSGEVVGVRLAGLRNRWNPLVREDNKDFQNRLMKRPNGEVTDPAVLRGIPNTYAQEGQFLMLWPSPAHNWTIEIDTVKKEQAVA
jgi:hypothetical protein